MLKLITAKTSILLPGGIFKKPGMTFMCDSAFADKLIAAENAVKAIKSVESTENKDISEMTAEEAIVYAISDKTIKELKAIAESNGIELDKSLTKRDDIFNTVKEGLVRAFAEKDI